MNENGKKKREWVKTAAIIFLSVMLVLTFFSNTIMNYSLPEVATQYVDLEGHPTMDEEWNVNGSYGSIEGIISPDGRIFGKMGHAERIGEAVAVNIYGEQDMKLFESGVEYFK